MGSVTICKHIDDVTLALTNANRQHLDGATLAKLQKTTALKGSQTYLIWFTLATFCEVPTSPTSGAPKPTHIKKIKDLNLRPKGEDL